MGNSGIRAFGLSAVVTLAALCAVLAPAGKASGAAGAAERTAGIACPTAPPERADTAAEEGRDPSAASTRTVTAARPERTELATFALG